MILVSADLPNEWRELLADIQQKVPGAIIAGGCLRDLANNVPPKDIDIFLPNGSSIADVEEIVLKYRHGIRRMGDLTYVTGEVNAIAEFLDNDFAEVDGKWVFADVRIPINVIVANDDTLDLLWLFRMDFGVNRILYDGKYVQYTDAFAADMADRVFKYRAFDRTPENAQRSVARAERFKMRYPDWRFELPEVSE